MGLMDYFRVIFTSGILCLLLIIAAWFMAAVGERDGLYLAFAGVVGCLMTVVSCFVGHLIGEYLKTGRKR
jgi:hypothetical protein